MPANVQPGTYNLVLRTQTQMPYNKDPKAKQKPNTIVVLPSAPVTLTILPKSLAKLTLSTPNATVKLSKEAEVVVRVQRQFGYDGEFKVQVVLPPGQGRADRRHGHSRRQERGQAGRQGRRHAGQSVQPDRPRHGHVPGPCDDARSEVECQCGEVTTHSGERGRQPPDSR